jgi:hypothetical protein
VVSIVENTMQLAQHSAITEADRFGLHTTKSSLTEVTPNEATLMQLMTYRKSSPAIRMFLLMTLDLDNTNMCAEHVTFQQTNFIAREIVPLSLELIEKLPRDLVNCILGNAAVHMASRQPGNRQLERLALETKVNIFQSFNRLLHSPQNQQPDVIICCGMLIFAIDVRIPNDFPIQCLTN